jgi:hypothetical protein
MAWAQSATCSLVEMLYTLFPTVLVLRECCLAIEGLGRPWAMMRRISRSRSVRVWKARGGAPPYGQAEK